MKFLSINACGLLSKLHFSEFNELIQEYDIIGIQGTKWDDVDIVNIRGYNIFCNNRRKISRYRSGRTALLVKDEIVPYVKVLKNNSKLMQWFSISNKITRTSNDICCGLIYLPPRSSRYSFEDPYLEIQSELNSVSLNDIILFGNLNSWTANLKFKRLVLVDEFMSHMYDNDILTNENAETPQHFESNNVPLDRNTVDTMTNAYGYQLLDFCRSKDIFIVNGRFGLDSITPNLTCKDASTVDYFLTTASIFSHISNFDVLDFSPFYSDSHSAVTLTFEIWPESSCTFQGKHQKISETPVKVKLWSRDKSQIFTKYLDKSCIVNINSKSTISYKRQALLHQILIQLHYQ